MNVMLSSPTYGKFYFDAVFKTDHSDTVNVTTNPVQVGAEVADHAYVEPSEVKMEVGFSAVNPSGKNPDTYITTILNKLDSIMRAREPLTLTTRLKQYSNMIITAKSYPDDYTTMNSVRISLSFKEVRIVSAKTVQVKDSTSSGKKKNGSGDTGGGSYSHKVTWPGGTKWVNAKSDYEAFSKVILSSNPDWEGTCTINGKRYAYTNKQFRLWNSKGLTVVVDDSKKQENTRLSVVVQNVGDKIKDKVGKLFHAKPE